MVNCEKPFLIYALPRSRSTAILQASKKPIIIYEPFNPNIRNSSEVSWYELKNQLNNKDASIKILCSHFKKFHKAKIWYDHVQREKRFKIFVVQRDIREICHSYMIAPFVGFEKQYESREKDLKGKIEIQINEIEFEDLLTTTFQSFLDFFPEYGTVINWKNLPEDFFDKTKVNIQEQFSQTKLDLVKNLDSCLLIVEKIVKQFEPLIDDKLCKLRE
jgi:hypothetical protein